MKSYYSIRLEGSSRVAIADVSWMPITPTLEGWVVNRINVPDSQRLKGYGHKLLVQICEDADREQVYLHLQPMASGSGGLSQLELEEWYGRHGFEWIDPGFMTRLPNCLQDQIG